MIALPRTVRALGREGRVDRARRRHVRQEQGGRAAARLRGRVRRHAHRSPRRIARRRGSGSCRRGASATTRRTAARRTPARRRRRRSRRRYCCASASASSRRSSTGSRNSTSSSTRRYASMSVDAAGAEPVAHALDELLRRGGAARHADDVDAVHPRLVDLALVVDQVRGDTACARDLDEPVRVRRVARADHEQQIDLRQHLLHRPLAVGGRVTDVLALRRVDVGEARAAAR